MNKQLKEKDGNAFKDVFPINIIQNIKDRDTGKTLQNILKSFNSIFVEYKNSVEETRNSIDESIRRKGLWVTYLPTGEQDYVTEVYIGNEESIFNNWADNSNWKKILNVDYNSTVEGKIPNGVITMEKLSPALQELLKQNNNIINYPDDEDLQADYGYLQFKDRKYNPDLASGKGYKILRKNWLGVNNVLTQDMVNEENTIYVIRYDFDLNGKEITIPEGCVLQFEGGSLSNGKLNGDNTNFINNLNINILKNIEFKGTFNNTEVTPYWFNAKGDGINDDTKAFSDALYVCNNIYVPKGNYIIHCPQQIGGLIDYGKHPIKESGIIINKSNVSINFSKDAFLIAGELPKNEIGNRIRSIICIAGDGYYDGQERKIKNININGGNFIGGRSQFKLEKELPWNDRKENYLSFLIIHADDVNITNCNIQDNSGDGILTMAADNICVENCNFKRNRRAAVSIGSGNNFIINKCTFKEEIQYIKYNNGNYSYSTNPSSIISPESDSYTSATGQKVDKVIVENCIFDIKNTDSINKGRATEYYFRNNIIINGNIIGFYLQFNDNTKDKKDKIEIYNNYFDLNINNYSDNYSKCVFSLIDDCKDIVINNNIIKGLYLTSIGENIDKCIINNNNIEYISGVIIKTSSFVDNTIIFKNNTLTSHKFIDIETSKQDKRTILIIDNNYCDSSYKFSKIQSTPIIGYIDGLKELRLINNTIINNVYDRFIIKSIDNNSPLIIERNRIEFNKNTQFYMFNLKLTYIKADIINNTIITKGIMLINNPSTFSHKLNIINNIFGGTLKKLVSEDAPTNNLNIVNNVTI